MRIEIDPRAQAIPEHAQQCRAENHHWQRLDASATETTRRGVITVLEVIRECRLCGSLRIDDYALPAFTLIRRRYRYAAGYAIKYAADEVHLSKEDFVRAHLVRELKDLLT